MLVDGRWVPTFPRARYLFSRTEFDHWMRLRKEGSTHHLGHLYDAIDPVVEAGLADFIPPDFHVTDEVSLFPTPGHTPGHVSVLIRSGAMEAVITGDMLHHPIQLVEPELQANFDEDVSQGALTRKTFVERFADTPTMIIGSHFCDPTSGWIVRDGKRCKLRIE
jgi:glyoxylase-like metal-dependent hydrolase (beta-lactamase superfamily II)